MGFGMLLLVWGALSLVAAPLIGRLLRDRRRVPTQAPISPPMPWMPPVHRAQAPRTRVATVPANRG